MPKITTAEQLAIDWAQALPAAYIECRGNGRHAWRTLTPMHHVERSDIEGNRRDWVQEDLICARCEMQRHDVFKLYRRAGVERLHKHTELTRYTQPLGYARPPGLDTQSAELSDILYGEKYRRSMRTVARVPDYVTVDAPDA